MRYRGQKENGIVKHKYGGKENLVKNHGKKTSPILQSEPKTVNPNMDMGIHYNLNSFD